MYGMIEDRAVWASPEKPSRTDFARTVRVITSTTTSSSIGGQRQRAPAPDLSPRGAPRPMPISGLHDFQVHVVAHLQVRHVRVNLQ
jgi:hypothetical protein